jgi:hypothetical protein
MQNAMIIVLLTAMLLITGCREITRSQLQEYDRGSLKLAVRTQEFNNSGVHNVDVCITASSSRAFPDDKGQCLMHGYDISDLSVAWKSDKVIVVSLDCGRITSFSNHAVVPIKGSSPVEIYAELRDTCDASSMVPKH